MKVWLTRDRYGLSMWPKDASPKLVKSQSMSCEYFDDCEYECTCADIFFDHFFGLKMNERGLFNIRLTRVPIPKDEKNNKESE